jgi:predicted DNA-binding protein
MTLSTQLSVRLTLKQTQALQALSHKVKKPTSRAPTKGDIVRALIDEAIAAQQLEGLPNG